MYYIRGNKKIKMPNKLGNILYRRYSCDGLSNGVLLNKDDLIYLEGLKDAGIKGVGKLLKVSSHEDLIICDKKKCFTLEKNTHVKIANIIKNLECIKGVAWSKVNTNYDLKVAYLEIIGFSFKKQVAKIIAKESNMSLEDVRLFLRELLIVDDQAYINGYAKLVKNNEITYSSFSEAISSIIDYVIDHQ